MATPKITPFPSPAQVPETPHKPPQEITQGDLSYILATRMEVDRLKANLAEAEESVKSRLEAGASVAYGAFRARLKENLRRNVAWKSVVVRLANRLGLNGEAYCSNVLGNTKPTRVVSLHIA